MTTPDTTQRSICPAHSTFVVGCDDCREYAAAWARRRTRLEAYGQWEVTADATAAREHIGSLIAAGMTQRAVARISGVNKTVIAAILSGAQAQARPETIRRILATDPVLLPSASVSSLGASRRLRALMAAGWDSESLAPLLGTSANQVRRWRWRSQPAMRFDVHQRIAGVYRQIGDRQGPSGKARAQARFNGYAAPIFWDDDGDLDKPQGRPKEFAVAVPA